MSQTINLSVIIPHYNSPKSLRKLLLSVPKREDFQILVVDDNSTKEVDKLEQLRMEMQGRVQFYRNESGIQSAGACRNIGMEHAKGKWILFADADDYFLPELQERIEPYFESDLDMVIFSPVSEILGTTKSGTRHLRHEERIQRYLENPSRDNYLSLCRTTTIWSKLIRAEVIVKNHIRCSTTRHGNDFVCSQQLFYYCEKKEIRAEAIYCVTQGEGSLTAAKSVLAFENSVTERTKGYLFDRAHYQKKDLYRIDLSAGESLINGVKWHVGMKKLLWGFWYFKKNKVHLMPKRLWKRENLRNYKKKGYLI